MADEPILRLCDALDQRPKATARDIVAHMQCFGPSGEPLFTSEQIATLLRKVGQIALDAAEEGDDRRLKRMLDVQIKLAAVNQKLQELAGTGDEADDILARLRERQRAAGA